MELPESLDLKSVSGKTIGKVVDLAIDGEYLVGRYVVDAEHPPLIGCGRHGVIRICKVWT